ncbi:MAG: DMT family transporter [Kiloniellales bacterium]|nr:DMT family transporter [Kiloniellales bacterium]
MNSAILPFLQPMTLLQGCLAPGRLAGIRPVVTMTQVMPNSSSLLDRFEAVPPVIQGAAYMTAAAFCFAIMNVLVRIASESLDPIQIAFFRNLFALVFVLPLIIRGGGQAVKTKRLGLHGLRALLGIIAMFFWFTAVTLVPLAEAVALNFTLPLFATAGAALILRETVGLRRWGATACGFIGMLVILRPGFNEITFVTWLPIIAALFMAASVLTVKRLSASESPQTVVLYMNLFMTPLSLGPALFVWQWPTLEAFLACIVLGLLAMVAHLALTRSYAKADASAVMPFDYMRLPFIAAIAFFLYGEVADLWTWAGAGIIAGASFYIARREAFLARQSKAEPTAALATKGR